MKNFGHQLSERIKFALRVLIVSAKRYRDDQNSQRAVALTYYTLFAIVPLAALSFGVAKGFDAEIRLRQILSERFSQHEELLNYVYHFADTTLRQASGGVVAGVGVFALIWTVMWLAGNIENAFNAVWDLPLRKNLLRKFSDYLAIVLLLPLFMAVLGSAGVFLRALFSRVESRLTFLGSVPGYMFSLASGLLPLLLVILIFSVIYYTSPNTKVKLVPAVCAGVVAGICFQILQDSFIFLQGSIYNYNRIYGSFAALPLFLIWMQWSWQIALFGAEIGFVAQKLESGLFDDSPTGSDSPRRRRVLQLTICAWIYRKFINGRGASSFSELQNSIHISAVQLDNGLSALMEAGLILKTASSIRDEWDYSPALPPEKTTVLDCCLRLEKPGCIDNPVLGSINETLHEFDEAVKLSAANRKIFEL